MDIRQKCGKRMVRIMDGIVNGCVMIFILIMLLFGTYSLIDSNVVYEEAAAAQYEEYNPVKKSSLSFDQLRAINPEVFSWLHVNGTHIDYPVCQADNNEKYINTNAKGQYALSGSLFLDYQNNPHFKDYNSIIYGHHLDEDVMFGELGYFEKKEYFDQHKYGNLFFDGKNHGLEFFAFLTIDAYDVKLYTPALKEPGARKEYLNYILKKARHTRDIGLKDDDRIVLLSTCTSEMTNGRSVLVGRISGRYYPDHTKVDENKGFGIDPDALFGWWLALPLLVRIFILILLLLVLLLLLYKIKEWRDRRKQSKKKKKAGK